MVIAFCFVDGKRKKNVSVLVDIVAEDHADPFNVEGKSDIMRTDDEGGDGNKDSDDSTRRLNRLQWCLRTDRIWTRLGSIRFEVGHSWCACVGFDFGRIVNEQVCLVIAFCFADGKRKKSVTVLVDIVAEDHADPFNVEGKSDIMREV